MPTYDQTVGGPIGIDCRDNGRFFVARIPIVVSEIIAAHAVLKAAGKIAAADVIQLWDIPANVSLLGSMATFKIISPGTAAGTANIGIAGSNELFAAIALDSAALSRITCVPKNGGWGTDNYGAVDFEATDTIDMTFVADETIGSFVLYIPGYTLD
jgi:hypothetical protein